MNPPGTGHHRVGVGGFRRGGGGVDGWWGRLRRPGGGWGVSQGEQDEGDASVPTPHPLFPRPYGKTPVPTPGYPGVIATHSMAFQMRTYSSARSSQHRNTSATLQAWAKQPPGL